MTKRKVVVNFSGGKDSTAALIKVLERYPKEEVILVFEDTGAEFLETPGHCQLIADMVGVPLYTVSRDGGFWGLVEHNKYFPRPSCRYCTDRLKAKPFNKWLTKNFKNKGYEIIVVTGIRGDESTSRSKLHEWEDPKERGFVASASKLWMPCIDMTAKEVKQLVRAEGLPLHPCYDFSNRCACWCCIMAPRGAVRTYADAHPELIKQALEMEEKIKDKWKHRLSFDALMRQPRLL